MLYKEFEKELTNICEKICSKYNSLTREDINCDYYEHKNNFRDEIGMKIQNFLEKEIPYCDVHFSYPHFFSPDFCYTIFLKNNVIFRGNTDFIRFAKVTFFWEDYDNNGDHIINNIKFKIDRVSVNSPQTNTVIVTPHPYLKSFENKKIKLKDDINELSANFRQELENTYRYHYFSLISKLTETSLLAYELIQKSDFLSSEFRQKIQEFGNLLYLTNKNIIKLENIEYSSLEKKLNGLFKGKRIYSVCFEIFENSNKIDEEYFQALPMSQIKYYHTYLKDSFFEKIHTPACGTALIRMTISNVCTGRVKTVDDSFNY